MVRLQNVLFQTQAQCFLWKWQIASTSDSNLRWALFTNGIMQALLELELGFTCLQMPTRVGWKKNRKSKFVFSSDTHPYCWKKQNDSCEPHVPFATLSLMIWGWDFFFFKAKAILPPSQDLSLRDQLSRKPPSPATISVKDYPHARPLEQEITFMTDHSPKTEIAFMTDHSHKRLSWDLCHKTGLAREHPQETDAQARPASWQEPRP